MRDHVFDVLRARRSLGDGDGRALMARLALREGWDIATFFSGQGHAPAALSEDEAAALRAPLDLPIDAACDLPEWLWPAWQDSLGADAIPAAQAQQHRAPVFLRVNAAKAAPTEAIASLAQDTITATSHEEVKGCLRVNENARKIKASAAYKGGLVELQDAASQAAVALIDLAPGQRVLDFCAGGGGKALAFAAAAPGIEVFAHDAAPERMRDLPARAARAGAQITCLATADLVAHGPYDLVFCDAPCSGSGTWRRTPDAKWRLTQSALDGLNCAQDAVLAKAAALVRQGGVLAYATCSVLRCENEERVTQMLTQEPRFRLETSHHWRPSQRNDGFFLAIMTFAKTT